MKKLLLIIPVLIVTLTACDSVNFDDSINADKDAVTEPNVNSLMVGAMNRFFTLGGRNYWNKPYQYVQYQSQYVYTATSRYGVVAGLWNAWYVPVLKNLNVIVDINSADKIPVVVQSYGAPVNQIGVAEIFSVFVWKRFTDTYGPIPYKQFYNEAKMDPVYAPKYTPQEQIYKDLVKRLQKAREMLDPSLKGPTGDVVYGGNVNKWKKYANSLLMSLAIQMSNVYPDPGGYAAQVFKEALNHPAGAIDDISEEMWYDYTFENGSQNPYAGIRDADYSLAEALVKAMKGKANGTVVEFSSNTFDTRLKLYANDVSLPGREYGVVNESSPGAANFAAISSAVSGASSPIHYMTAAYTYLNRAEAAALGWTSEDPQALLKQAIISSYKSYEAHYNYGEKDESLDLASKGASFAQARLDDASRVGILQVIREEKWVTLFPRSFQPWAEWRRTDTPWLLPAPDAINGGIIPTRYPYPTNEVAVNNSNYKSAVQMLQPAKDNNKTQFWWDTE